MEWLLRTNNTSINKSLEPNVKFEIPIYQRTYDWTKKHCKQLYDDIIKTGSATNERSHFIGAVTYVSEAALPGGDVDSYQVIDGQQRLTTIMLLLRALKQSLNGSEKSVTKKKIDQLLFNVNEEKGSQDYYKLVLTEDDDQIFRDIMENGKSDGSNNIVTNFKNFVSWLSSDVHDHDIIWHGIRRLMVVQILIDEKDDAQAIFESMNSTGLDLSETDMIQNYLLMSEKLERQKRIYREYWKPMEKRFGEERGEYFEDFLRNYLMMHRGKIVSKREMYEYFKKHMDDLNKEEEIKKLNKYSEYYANLICIKPHASPTLKKVIRYVYDQDTNVANSLLLKVLADHANGVIDEKEVEAVFLLVDSYLLRCHICETTKGGNKVFPEVIPTINEQDYAKSIEKTLMSKTGNRRFPRNVIFREKLERLALYNNRTMCRYMLIRLEHEKSRESVRVENLSIEHIMPKTLNDDWKNDLGENWKDVHERHLHNIGNLTLTAYNPELGNDAFSYKLKKYKESKVTLTQELEGYTDWNQESIMRRAKILTEHATKLWKCPEGYDQDIDDTGETLESDYLDRRDVTELWNVLKEKIISTCNNGVTFHMTSIYGAFRLPVKGSKDIGICSIEARKNKIFITYNTRIQDCILESSKFVRDISNVGHYSVGDFRSTIMSEEDIDNAIQVIKTLWDAKLED